MKKVRFFLAVFATILIGIVSCDGGKKSDKDSQCCTEKTVSEVVETEPRKEKKVVVARVLVKEGQEKNFIEVASKLVNATRGEVGNLFYTMYQSPMNESEFIFYEEYKDEDSFQKHASSEHFAAFVEGTKDIMAGDLIVDEF